jgi:serine/threonine-protein kinase
VEKLGSGGMGSVWLSHDLSLDSNCALKIIDPEKSRSEEVRKRFVREAKAAAQLRGPHVVDVFDRGEFEGVLYIAMEYLEGEDLCSRLARVGRLDPATTYRVIAHVARALSSAHALGIVHRDLKPENIFLVPSYDEEIAKVLDFGIAQHEAYRIEDHATREGSFLGTPYYVSPEQARGKPTDHRSDLWSLAVITYQCLTGQPPFDSDSLGELMGLILYEPIPRITDANPELGPEVEAFWSRATQRDRELRFQSARDFADHLGRALGVKTVVTVPTLPPRRPMSTIDEGDPRVVVPPIQALRTPRQLKGLTPPFEDSLKKQPLDAATLMGPDSSALGATDQAVTQSRSTVDQLRQSLAWGIERLKLVPKKALFATAVGIGALLGAVVMFFVFTRSAPAAGAKAPNEIVVLPAMATAASVPSLATVTPPSSLPSAPEVAPVEVLPQGSADRKASEAPARKSPGNPGLRRAPAGTPDYGI